MGLIARQTRLIRLMGHGTRDAVEHDMSRSPGPAVCLGSFLLAAWASACGGTGAVAPDAGDGSSDGTIEDSPATTDGRPAACIAAGGRCVLGGAVNICAKQGPSGCNTDPPNPGGAFCCLEFLDSGDGGGTSDADAAASEGSPDAGSCRSTVDAYCASDASSCLGCRCVPDWSTAKSPSQWCPSSTAGSNRVFVYSQCDGFNLVVVGYADTSTFYYYDPVTLKLVRVENHGNGGSLCVAGQAGPVVPLTDCLDGASPTSICASDAAAD